MLHIDFLICYAAADQGTRSRQTRSEIATLSTVFVPEAILGIAEFAS